MIETSEQPRVLTTEPVLEGRNLRVRYGRGCSECFKLTGAEAGTNICPDCGSVVALNAVNMAITPGTMLGIIGESGSGKSTLLRIVSGIEPPESGEILFRDEEKVIDIAKLDAAQRRRLKDRRFGIVYQNPHLGLNFRFSSGGNIAERVLAGGIRNYGVIRQRATGLLERTRVPVERIDESPKNFSGGMQQRVQISKALAIDPAVLFLDEVTSGLDLSVQARILDLLLELHRRLKLTMLVVTHDIGVVRMLTNQTVVMRYGQVVEAGLTDQIIEDPQHPYTQELIHASL
jgi:putative phosphonate transport system ATP-binding protein